MRILIATAHVPFQRDDAQRFADDLCEAFRAAGHDAEVFAVPLNPRAPERLLDQMLACRLLDVTEVAGERVDLLVGLRFPAYHVAHPNKILWLADEQLLAGDLAGDAHDDPRVQADDARVRDAVRRADCDAVREAKKIFTVSRRVSMHLQESCGVDSTPLQQPPPRAGEFQGDAARVRHVRAPDENLETGWSRVVRELLR